MECIAEKIQVDIDLPRCTHENVISACASLTRNGDGSSHPALCSLSAARITQPGERIKHAAPRITLDAFLKQTTRLLLHATVRRVQLPSRSRRRREPDA